LFNDLFAYIQKQEFVFIEKKKKITRLVKICRLSPENKHHLDMILGILRKIREFRVNDNLRKKIIDVYTKLKQS
jgi:hypothetical protein